MKSELEKLMSGYEYPISMIFEKRRTRNKGFNKNQFTLLEWCVVMYIQFNGNEFYHSYQSIADDTDISRGTVQSGLKELKQKGYISIRNLNMGKTNNECTNIRLHPALIVRDLDTIYDKEVCSFGYPKEKMYPSIEKFYKRLVEVVRKEKPDSIEKKQKKEKKDIDWDKIEEQLEAEKGQRIHEMIALIEQEEIDLPDCPEIDYVDPSQEDAEQVMFDLSIQENMKQQRIFFGNYMAGIGRFDELKDELTEQEFAVQVLKGDIQLSKMFYYITDKQESNDYHMRFKQEAGNRTPIKQSDSFKFLCNWWKSKKEVITLLNKYNLFNLNMKNQTPQINTNQIAYLTGLLKKKGVNENHIHELIEQMNSIRVSHTQVSGIIDELKAVA
jgi:DNA-binding transcriptional regulator YhcF (GntR family)